MRAAFRLAPRTAAVFLLGVFVSSTNAAVTQPEHPVC